MHALHSFGASALTLALAVTASAPALAQSAPAELHIDVATHAAAGMPGSGVLGRLAGAMAGREASYGMTRHPGMPGRYLDIALHNQRQPGAPARQAIPPGLRLGAELELLPPSARESRASGNSDGNPVPGLADGSSYRMLYFWGCGDQARPGQPAEYSMTIRNGQPAGSGKMMTPRSVARRGIDPGPEFALWPNPASGRAVPEGASLVGTHHVTGAALPESLRFDLAHGHDFMPPLAIATEGGGDAGLALHWDGVTGARAHFIHGTIANGDTIVMWSSAEDAYAGPELLDYLSPQDITRLSASRTLMGADARSCTVPREVLAAAGGGMPVLQMIAYGDENTIAEPRPANAARDWRPGWNVQLRNKSTAMLTLGADGTPMDMGGAPPDAKETVKDRARGMLRGLIRR